MTFQVATEVQRRAARKMLRDAGMPTSEVHRMSYAALAAAMTERAVDASRYEALVAAWSAEAANAATSTPPTDAAASAVTLPVPTVPDATPGSVDASVRALVAAVVATLPASKAEPSTLDMDKVRAMIQTAVTEQLPVRVVIVKDGTETAVDGVVHYLFPDVCTALRSGVHIWLPGPAGSGKSTLARQALNAIGYANDRIQMSGAIQTPFQLLGYLSPSGDSRTLQTPFRVAYERGHAFIFDDVDRSDPKALAAFNEALANGHCAFPDGMVQCHADFVCIATANTFGLGGGADYVGAGRLDKATLDRFAFIEVPYDEKAERAIAGKDGADWCAFVQSVRGAVRRLGLKHLVTPRATYKGLRLLAAGLSRDKVAAATVYAGLDAETIARVRGAL